MTRATDTRPAARRADASTALASTALASLLALASSGCPSSPSNAGVGVALQGVSDATAMLKIVDDDGEPAAFEVKLADGGLQRFEGTAPVRCEDRNSGAFCAVGLVIDAGAYRFTLDVAQRDRCGASATTVSLSSGSDPVVLERGEVVDVDFDVDRTDFDDDGDGIVNALERVVCGRFDVADGALPPQHCEGEDACCARSTSVLVGQRSVFAGGPHERADGTFVDVAPFALDATELTWATFARCVAAGACLAGEPDHPVRVRLDDPALDVDAPVTGLLPREAEALCAWRGGHLPDDDVWDFAAAARSSGARARYPFDIQDGVDEADFVLGCYEGQGVLSANHAARGQGCPPGPVAVGSYPSTFVTRGAGSALADLAGNAGEWTVRRGVGAGPEDPTSGGVVTSGPFPDGVVEVAVRGGSAGGIVELLENDLAVRLTTGLSNVDARLGALAATTGVRCAFVVDDVAAAATIAVVEEPPCGADR
jgi:formylglycine-generating enzyme required for sulfatase activity